MATLIDERPEDVETEQEEISQIQEEPQVEETPQEEEIPDKYKGKSTAEIVRMHQEAEKLLGKQSGEVGELRSVVDNYIQTQLDTNTPATQEPEEDIDFFSDPERLSRERLRIILQLKLLKHKLSSTSSKQRRLNSTTSS